MNLSPFTGRSQLTRVPAEVGGEGGLVGELLRTQVAREEVAPRLERRRTLGALPLPGQRRAAGMTIISSVVWWIYVPGRFSHQIFNLYLKLVRL